MGDESSSDGGTWTLCVEAIGPEAQQHGSAILHRPDGYEVRRGMLRPTLELDTELVLQEFPSAQFALVAEESSDGSRRIIGRFPLDRKPGEGRFLSITREGAKRVDAWTIESDPIRLRSPQWDGFRDGWRS